MSEILTSIEVGAIFGIVAIGIYMTFRVIDFADLSCDGSFVLGSSVSAVLVKHGLDPFLALFFAACAGALAGIVTGILYTKCKISELLSGILVASMLYSVNLRVMGVPNITMPSGTVFSGMDATAFSIFLASSVCVALCYILNTDFGLGLRAVGQNKRLSYSCGMNVATSTIIALAISNAFIGMGGAVYSQYQGFVDISQGIGTVVTGLAAVIIGEKIIPSRSVWLCVPACIIGSIVYRILIAMALHGDWIGLESQDLNIITGLMLISVMLFKRRRDAVA